MSEQFECVFCKSNARFMCEKCFEIYCSRECQRLDWRTHKFICTLMPNLVPRNEIQTRLTSQMNGLKELDLMPINVSADKCDAIKTENISVLNEQCGTKKLQENEFENTAEEHNHVIIKNEMNTALNGQLDAKILQENGFETILGSKPAIDRVNNVNVATKQCNGENNRLLFANNIRFHKIPSTLKVSKKLWRYRPSYPKNTYFNVEIQHISEKDSSLLWVVDQSHITTVEKMLVEVNKCISAASAQCSEREIAVGELVVCLPPADFEQIYYRAIVLEEKNPLNEVRVRLIDYGNEFLVKVKNLKSPLPLIKNDPAYALCIRYTKKPVKIGQQLSIKIVGIEENGEVLTIENDAQTSSPEKKNHVLSSYLTVSVVKLSERNEAIVIALDEEISNLLKVLCTDMENNLKKKEAGDFREGDFVMGKVNNTWHRGFLVGSAASKHLIYCSDIARHEFAEQIQYIPLSYRYIPSLSFILNITKSQIEDDSLYGHYFATDTTFRLEKLDEISPSVYDLYYEEKKLATVTIEKWKDCLSMINSKGNFWTPNSGDLVRITYVDNESLIYICKTEKYQFYSDIFKELGEKASNGRISVGEIVLVQWKTYVRCKILKIYGSTVSVIDIDSGMYFEVSATQVKEANKFVKLAPVFSSKVSLKHLPTYKTYPSLNAALVKLNSFAEEKRDFTVLYDRNNVVELFEAGSMNHSINKDLVPLLFEEDTTNCDLDRCLRSPTIATALSFINDFFSIDNVEVIDIPAGRDLEVVILDNSAVDTGVLTVCKNDDAFLKQQEQNNQKIVEYCLNLGSSNGYAPRLNEMCFAIFDLDGQWYRASCLRVNEEDYTLLYTDYGNIGNVKKENIRMFNKDFMYSTHANTCSIDGLPQALSPALLNSIKEMLEINTILRVDRIFKYDDGQPTLEIESVKNMLKGV